MLNAKTIARKQARTRIYTALYGPQAHVDAIGERRYGYHGKRPNQPWLDASRTLGENFDIRDILALVQSSLWRAAAFDHNRRRILQERLEALAKLKGIKPSSLPVLA